MVIHQRRKRRNEADKDMESCATSYPKDVSFFNYDYFSKSVDSGVPGLNTKGSCKIKNKHSLSITVSQFVFTTALLYFYLTNMKALRIGNVAISSLNAEIEDLRHAKNDIGTRVSASLKEINVLHASYLKKEEEASKNQSTGQAIDYLQTQVNNFYSRELETRFGSGPYYIEVAVIINGRSRVFTMQTVSDDDTMNHSVYVFMDMMDRKVWDNSTFIQNNNHVLHIAPLSPDGDTHEVDRNLEKLEFPEYSKNHHHEKNTLCFSSTGRGMYLNLKNSEMRGTVEQSQNEIQSEDPCFAKAVIGMSTISSLKEGTFRFEEGNAELLIASVQSMKRVLISKERLALYGLSIEGLPLPAY